MTSMAAGLSVPRPSYWRHVLVVGLIGAATGIYLSLVGIVPTFDDRPLIAGVLSLGEGFVLATLALAGYFAAQRVARTVLWAIFAGAIAGLISGAALSLLILVGGALQLRSMFIQASSRLYDVLTAGQGSEAFWIPTVGGLVIGALAGGVAVLPQTIRRAVVVGVIAVGAVGLFAGLLRTPLLASDYAWLGRMLFAPEGLTVAGAAVTLLATVGPVVGAAYGAQRNAERGGAIGGFAGGLVGAMAGMILGLDLASTIGIGSANAGPLGALIVGSLGLTGGVLAGVAAVGAIDRSNVEQWYAARPQRTRRLVMSPLVIFLFLVVLVLPLGLGPFFAQVIALVALYILMGLGLNITLGLAGLLDLGFVAFFAVGAYTVALLTSTGPFGLATLSFWAAVPFAVLFAFMFGAFLGLPILGIRGDYLAIATLGFGEIIRILAVSDVLRPVLGGPQGIPGLPAPIAVAPSDPLAGPNQIYYIALACAALIAFIAHRLRNSRIGRAWIAIREDEDVAEALGINLVQTKLLAYALGAAFAGLGGAVFAGLVGAVFPTSINLFVSINVAALIIVGGMGSIPGVIVGAAFLIGLPELFREFAEYRYLFYGAALILIMRFRPEGLLPSRTIKRELHVDENVEPDEAVVGASVAQREYELEHDADTPYGATPRDSEGDMPRPAPEEKL